MAENDEAKMRQVVEAMATWAVNRESVEAEESRILREEATCRNCGRKFEWPELRRIDGHTCFFHPNPPVRLHQEAEGAWIWQYPCCGRCLRGTAVGIGGSNLSDDKGCVCGRHVGPSDSIFVSYSRKNSEIVDQVVNQLRDEGFQVWMDRYEIETGARWRQQLHDIIGSVDRVPLFATKEACDSEWVAKEIGIAKEQARLIYLVPLGGKLRISGIETKTINTRAATSNVDISPGLLAHKIIEFFTAERNLTVYTKTPIGQTYQHLIDNLSALKKGQKRSIFGTIFHWLIIVIAFAILFLRLVYSH